MGKSESLLVAAATALDEELRAYDALAEAARRAEITSEQTLERALALVKDSAGFGERIHATLQALVAQIDAARNRQVASLNTLVEAAHHVQARAEKHAAMVKRFEALGQSAQGLNALTAELSARRNDGASEAEVLEGLGAIDSRMADVVREAEALKTSAELDDWPEFARQAGGIRQQVLAAKNKLLLARRKLAVGAPS